VSENSSVTLIPMRAVTACDRIQDLLRVGLVPGVGKPGPKTALIRVPHRPFFGDQDVAAVLRLRAAADQGTDPGPYWGYAPPERAILMVAPACNSHRKGNLMSEHTAAAFSDVCGPPAWKKLPSWAVVATGDKAADADVVRSEAQRADADIVEVEGSHVIMISQPQVVTDHILKAVRAVAAAPR
jgi:hypothetical protein